VSLPVILILGLLIGWLVEWIIDLLYWRRPAAPAAPPAPPQAGQHILEERVVVKVREREDLQEIIGIGPTYAGRFHEKGIDTYEQLARLTPEEAVRIAKVQSWQGVDTADWIAQARALARTVEQETVVSETTTRTEVGPEPAEQGGGT
jgi:predicted flap endonuclease-1-like 5' DNA nuclease